MQPRSIKSIIIFILLVIIVSVWSSGCQYGSGKVKDAEDSPPFYQDRVVTVRLVATKVDEEYLFENATEEQYIKVDMWYDGELVPDIAVRAKGNSSLMTTAKSASKRYSLKVDLNFFNSARNLHGVKKLCFNNGFSDPTLLREALSYEVFALMGIPSPRTSFVDLWFNDTHLGVYTMVEAIDKTFIGNYFADNSGNLYKPEMPAAFLNWTQADYERQLARFGIEETDDEIDLAEINLGGGNLMQILEILEPNITEDEPDSLLFPSGTPRNPRRSLIEQIGLKTNENKADHSNLFRLLDILNNEPDATFPEEIEKVLDVDGALRYIAISALIVHLDNYIAMGHNYYLYDNNGKFVILPWDLNMAFGTFNYGLNRSQLINYYIDEPTGGAMVDRPLVNRLLSYQPYLDAYHGYLEELLDGPFSEARMKSRIDELASLIRPYVQKDDLKFFSNTEFETGLEIDTRGNAPGTRPRSIGLKAFVTERSKSVREQLEGTRISSLGNGSGNGGRFGIQPIQNQPLQPRQPQQPRQPVLPRQLPRQ